MGEHRQGYRGHLIVGLFRAADDAHRGIIPRMADLFDELRRKAADADSSVRARIADYLKGLCREIDKNSTPCGAAGNLPTLAKDRTIIDKAKPAPTLTRNAYDPALDWIDRLQLRQFTPYYSTARGAAINIDSMKVLKELPSASIDLVMTSPPFALIRKKEYGNEPVDRYLEWFLPFCREIKRVLKPHGSFVCDIGGSWVPGVPVRSLYHFELAVRLAKEFRLAQEFYWYNPAKLPTPAEWVTIRRIRVKDAVNMVWWFSPSDFPKADNKKVLKPYSDSMLGLIKNGYKAKKRPSGHDISDTFQRDNGGAIPPNLLEYANTESNSYYLRRCKELDIKPHPARYPEALVQFFIDFLTDENALVLDPFGGSNVTGAACEKSKRRWLACEQEASYLQGSIARFELAQAKEKKPSKPKPSESRRKTVRS